VEYWTIIEMVYTGAKLRPSEAAARLREAVAGVLEPKRVPDVSVAGSDRVLVVGGTVEAGSSAEAVAVLVDMIRRAVDVSDQTGGWDVPAAVLRVAPRTHAEQA
jgi:hypothetical protein